MKHPGRVSRRKFLKGLALAAAAPTIIPASALGQEGRPAPSERLNIAIIGIGNQGRGHYGTILGNRRLQVLAACDVRKSVRDNCRRQAEKAHAEQAKNGEYKGFETYNDFREMFARGDLDAVLIATPEHWHAIMVIDAAKAGLDIYCEKPLSHTIRQARAMVDAVRRHGRVFQTGSQQRSSSNFRLACELVRNGRIGKVQTVNVGVGGPSRDAYLPTQPVPDDLDWDTWLGPAPWSPYNEQRASGDYGGGWRMIRDYAGGMMCDWGAHHFDIAQWGLGMDRSGPVEIIPPDGKDHKVLTYRYANGVTMLHGGANGILFTGEEGKIEVNRGYLRTWPDSIGETPLASTDVHLYDSRGHMGDWLDCIRTRKQPICDVETGARTITVCHLGNIAVWLGRPIKWDPDTEQIIGDDEAARWLDRPMRAPWRL